MVARKEINKTQAVRYRKGSKIEKSDILDTVCEVTGYHRDYARRALRAALTHDHYGSCSSRPDSVR